MKAALLIARKDLRQRLRDKSAFIFGIIAPLGLSVIFFFVFGPINNPTDFGHFVYVDQDGGEIAAGFISVLESLDDEDIVVVEEADSVQDARARVEAHADSFGDEDAPQADVAFIIPDGFEALGTGGSAELEVVRSGASGFAGEIGQAVAEGFAAEVGAVGLAIDTVGVIDPAQAGALVPAALQTVNPVSLTDVGARVKMLDFTSYLAAGMAVMFVFFTVQFGVSGLLEEGRIGTMPRLLASPMPRRQIVVGKAIVAFVLGIVSMGVLLTVSTLLLGAEYGNPLGVAILIVAAVVSALGILAVVAAFAKTQEQAGNFGAIISMVLAFFGGTFFQVSQVGGILETISLATPHAHFLRGLAELKGGGIGDIWPSVAAMLAFGLVTGAAVWPRLQRSVGR